MDIEIGEILTRWTVRMAVACYALRLSIDIAGWRNRGTERAIRWLWTLGLALLITHVLCAFHYYHQWSHSAAYKHTARQTALSVGVDWGGGLFINYLFICIWMGDLAASWSIGDAYISRRRIYRSIQAIFAFMMINATVVFGPPFWKWAAASVTVGFIVLWIFRRRPYSD